VSVQEVSWDKEGTPRAGNFFMAKEMKVIHLEQDFLYITENYCQLME
jgi:hypothetical protein